MSKPEPAVLAAGVFWKEEAGEFTPVLYLAKATHVFSEVAAGEFTMTAKGAAASPARTRKIGNTYTIVGGL
jgi:hypothetical protein